ncbi:hypothetical protein VTK73DRAFT_5582 [Phialemonium thermophilum]|uniref:SGNH hydrolase-type esterase domain-containing protein n=1 Tax=Phialemonium thermophilum TaxID=223376 RepID=A0ABR3WN43_9PEZI
MSRLAEWLGVCTLAVLLTGRAAAAPHPSGYGRNGSLPMIHAVRQSDDTFDVTDLSYIRKLAALGDSYSAGIGAGNRLGSLLEIDSQGGKYITQDVSYPRYDHSYPSLVSQDPAFGDTPPDFQYLSCSGAVTEDVLEKQLPKLEPNQQAILLSIGGNDAELVDILNQCVFQFSTLNPGKIDIEEVKSKASQYDWAKNYDFEALARGCETQLARSAGLIASTDLANRWDAITTQAKAKLAAGGKIYWTGYAKFFAEDLSHYCDHVTWEMWIHKALYWQDKEYLTTDHRRVMNDLVDQMNTQLARAAERAGPDVIFIDYDDYVGHFHGRYCEAGVDESTTESTTRTGLMFYELNTADLGGTSPWKRSDDNPSNGSFMGEVDIFAEITKLLDPDSYYANQEVMANVLAAEMPDLKVEAAAGLLPNLIPDGYGRVFHPQILLHELIASLIIWNMMNVNEINHGLEPLPEQLGISACLSGIDPPPTQDHFLRILPLGASIVWGVGSSSGNGFRKPLRDALRQAGWDVNMVGSQNHGDMIDNNVEAKSGNRVDQIQAASALSTKYQPNVVIVNGGTNDCLQSYGISTFASRYNALLDSLYGAIPDVTIIASLVIPGTANGIPQNRDAVNGQIRNLVADRRGRGQKIVLADVDSPAGFFTTANLVADGTHPDDEGHRRLAALYVRAIEDAHSAGFLSPPADTGMSDNPGAAGGNNQCDKTYASGQSHGPVDTQAGSGLDDGPYLHSSSADESEIPRFGSFISRPAFNLKFARLNEPFGNHDMINHFKDGSYDLYFIYSNMGAGWDEKRFTLPPFADCADEGIRFVDVNDDLVCIAANGDTSVSINRGNYSFSGPQVWKNNEGSILERIHLPDIDGDGRADYCVALDNGDIKCWRNGGQGDLPAYWQPLGVVFMGKGFGDVRGIRFFDLNGDGRDDWIWMDDTGRTWTYMNNRGCDKGSLTPLWRAGHNADGSNYTHAGMGKTVGREYIHFAKVFGEPEAFSLGGRADYVWAEDVGTFQGFTSKLHIPHVWQNRGSGATKLKADGDRYCNMMGHANGAMDYVWVHSTGYMVLYESLGGTFPGTAPFWGPHYRIWTPSSYYDMDIDRRDLHLADWDGDGLCDVIYVDPDSGQMNVWLNQYKKTGSFASWGPLIHVGPRGDQKACTEKRGVGIFDLAVRFADITGNGLADYLCMEKDGRTWGYLQEDDGSLVYVQQIKKSEGKDRANLRWADVNADGRADLLWSDKFTGDTTVWYNRGPIAASGSSFTWDYQGPVFQGAAQGSCLNWPDLDGNGRADMHVVDSLTNTAQTWFNLCPGEGEADNGDDDDTLTAAPLPRLS